MGERDAAAFRRAMDAHHAVLAASSGFDAHYGRRLAGDLAAAGLAGVGCAGRASIWRGGEPGGRVLELTLRQLREPMLAAGLVAQADIDTAIALCADGLVTVSPLLMAAWGRRA